MDTLTNIQYDCTLIAGMLVAVVGAVVTVASALSRIFPDVKWLHKVALNPKKEVV